MLPPRARIAVVAPSHAFAEERYQVGKDWLESLGYQIVETAGLRRRHRYFAGDDAHRLAALVDALTRDDVDAVWSVRGGSGVTRLLGELPWEALQPRPVFGFSDLTPLLDQLASRGWPAVHAPVVHSLDKTDEASRAHLAAMLRGEPTAPLAGRTVVSGDAIGRLVGGNLCMLAVTCGTPFQLDAAGGILVLEEIAEHPYKVDRMLQQLRDSGVLRGISGVALGSFTGCEAPSSAEWSLSDVFDEHLGGLGVPVVAGLPIGHDAANRAWPVRQRAWLREGALGWGPPQG